MCNTFIYIIDQSKLTRQLYKLLRQFIIGFVGCWMRKKNHEEKTTVFILYTDTISSDQLKLI